MPAMFGGDNMDPAYWGANGPEGVRPEHQKPETTEENENVVGEIVVKTFETQVSISKPFSKFDMRKLLKEHMGVPQVRFDDIEFVYTRQGAVTFNYTNDGIKENYRIKVWPNNNGTQRVLIEEYR